MARDGVADRRPEFGSSVAREAFGQALLREVHRRLDERHDPLGLLMAAIAAESFRD